MYVHGIIQNNCNPLYKKTDLCSKVSFRKVKTIIENTNTTFLHVLVQKCMGLCSCLQWSSMWSYKTKHEGHSTFSIHVDQNVQRENNRLCTESRDFIAWGCALLFSNTQRAILFTSLLVPIFVDDRKII